MKPEALNKTAAEQAIPYLEKAMRSENYQRTIKKVASDLDKRDRRLSRIVHLPFIEFMSNLLSATLMRPAGILGGGLVSLLGTVTLLYLFRYHGLTYSFAIYFLLFLFGYLAGILIEYLLKLKSK